MNQPRIVMVTRSEVVADLIKACAEGALPFAGPNSLMALVNAMGFSTIGLYEAVMSYRGAGHAQR